MGEAGQAGHDPAMQPSLLADDDASASASAAAVMHPGLAGRFDEWRGQPGSAQPADGATGSGPAPRWRRFFDSLGRDGWSDLPARQRAIAQRVHDDGATYNVYAEQGQHSRPWPLEVLPFIVEPAEWAVIEQGVQQRARLLEATLADLYGGQRLLRDALLPASLVYAHPQYLRAMFGLPPLGGTRLHLCAFDLARSPGGGWTLLGQRVQAPSGLGYLLENRLIVAPSLRHPFEALRVQRVAAGFRSLLDGMQAASPAGLRSLIVLLTAGPLNETYFEQVFLARYLGLTLAEGSDLTVRANKLYLRTLHGLEQVHVLLRRVDDEFLDPLELRPDSALGVPGLLQALRAGEVVMANAPGAGVLESPGLAAFWPAVAQRLLGQELLLPAATSWWCGEASVWAAQRARLADFAVVPTFPGKGLGAVVAAHLGPAERQALAHQIDADPAAYTLQAPVLPSQTPVFVDGQLHPRSAVMRVFALADRSGHWHVLPGGLTRVASSQSVGHNPWLSMQHGSASIDTWVIASGAVDHSSLLPQPLTEVDLVGWRRSVTSRAAESLFWMGRYTERAENAARLARMTLDVLPGGNPQLLRLVGELARAQGLVGVKVPTPLQAPRVFERALLLGLGDSQGSSMAYNLRALKRCASGLRERLSPEHWQLIDQLDAGFGREVAAAVGDAQGHAAALDVQAVLARAAVRLVAITGAQTDHMTRDDGWRLLSVGRQIERLAMLSQALARGLQAQVQHLDDGFNLLLGLFDSVITYRAQFQAQRQLLPLLHLLVRDTDNPRSLAWVARTMRERLAKLARSDPDWVAATRLALPVPEDWPLADLARPDADGQHRALVRSFDDCVLAARGLSEAIDRQLFAHVASTDRRVWQ